MIRAEQMLDLSKARVITEPYPIAVCFRNVSCLPIGKTREAIWECLPTSALLSKSFVGVSVMELLTDNWLKERIIAPSKAMNEREAGNFTFLRCNQIGEK